MATPEETKETMQTETTSDNEVKETVEETTTETAVENDEATFDTIKKERLILMLFFLFDFLY